MCLLQALVSSVSFEACITVIYDVHVPVDVIDHERVTV